MLHYSSNIFSVCVLDHAYAKNDFLRFFVSLNYNKFKYSFCIVREFDLNSQNTH